MPYNRQLNEIIANSKKSLKEIAIECKREGVEITQSYIGIIKNNEDRIPSEEVTRAICKVCDADANVLIIEGAVDKAPQILKDKLEELRKAFTDYIAPHMENVTIEQMHEISKRISYKELLESISLGLEQDSKNADNIKEMIKAQEEHTILNNDLEPTVPKGAKFKIKKLEIERIKTGDFIVYEDKQIEYKKFIARVDGNIIVKDKKGFKEIEENKIKIIGIIEKKTIRA